MTRLERALAADPVLTDRVPYCVVKRNCPGPSIRSERREGRTGITERWTCRHCGGFAFSPDGATPPMGHKIEP
ncbi:MAG TPA: hypothetical protein VKU41_18760 [Polyangiaceae bacterium]|nr:hypothetical protein [Polyangiaceae bacterium]